MELLIALFTYSFIFSFRNREANLLELKWAAIVGLTLIIVIARIMDKCPLKYVWLRHYLLGSGKAMEVPSEIIRDAAEALKIAVLNDSPWGRFGSYHCLDHSTLYEGSGFWNRPDLFYLLGGFTFLLRRDGKVSGKDRYDWHPNEYGQYFTSPMGCQNGFVKIIFKILNAVFANDWFVEEGFPSGEAGISNKLWADFEEVGAKPFWSWFQNVDIFSQEQLLEIAVGLDREESEQISVLPCATLNDRINVAGRIYNKYDREYGGRCNINPLYLYYYKPVFIEINGSIYYRCSADEASAYWYF